MTRDALIATLHAHHADGNPPPCWNAPALWTIDDEPAQHMAAKACRACPAVTACRAYGLEHHREAGVYGGLTEKQRMRTAGPAIYTGSPMEGVEQCAICLHPMARTRGAPPVGMVRHHARGMCATCASFARREGIAR